MNFDVDAILLQCIFKEKQLTFWGHGQNESHWASRTKPPKVVGVHEVDVDIALSMEVDALTQKLDLLIGNCSSSNAVLFCETCGGWHGASQCPISSASATPTEYVDYVNGGQGRLRHPYSKTYNLEWKNPQTFLAVKDNNIKGQYNPQNFHFNNHCLKRQGFW